MSLETQTISCKSTLEKKLKEGENKFCPVHSIQPHFIPLHVPNYGMTKLSIETISSGTRERVIYLRSNDSNFQLILFVKVVASSFGQLYTWTHANL